MSDIRPNKLHELASYSVQYDLYMMHPEDFNHIQDTLMYNTDGEGNLQSLAFQFIQNSTDRLLISSSGNVTKNSKWQLQADGGVNVLSSKTNRHFVGKNYHINNININSYISPSKKTGGAKYTNATLSISEPYGATLVENLIKATVDLEQKKYHEMPYLLKLTFKGWDQEGNVSSTQFQNVTTKWLMVKMGNIDFKVDQDGTNYTIEMFNYSDSAFGMVYGSLPADIQVNAFTLGEFFQFQDIGDMSNGGSGYVPRSNDNNRGGLDRANDGANRGVTVTKTMSTSSRGPAGQGDSGTTTTSTYATSKTYKSFASILNTPDKDFKGLQDTYAFALDVGCGPEALTAFKYATILKADSLDANNMPVYSDLITAAGIETAGISANPNAPGSTALQLSKGMGIETILKTVISTSTFMTSQVSVKPNPNGQWNGPPGSPQAPPAVIYTLDEDTPLWLYKLTPVIRIGSWDDVRNQYQKHITYVISLFKSNGRAETSTPLHGITDVVKSYDYVYTGQNKDVLEFDLAFNTAGLDQRIIGGYRDGLEASVNTNDLPPSVRAQQESNNPIANYHVDPFTTSYHHTRHKQGIWGSGSESDYRTVMARNFMSRIYQGGADQLTAQLTIVGDPDFITQQEGFGISKHSSLYVNNSVNTHKDPIIKLNFFTPPDINTQTGLLETHSGLGDAVYGKHDNLIAGNTISVFSGYYRVLTIETSIEDNIFRQVLDIIRVEVQEEPTEEEKESTLDADIDDAQKKLDRDNKEAKLYDSSIYTRMYSTSEKSGGSSKRVYSKYIAGYRYNVGEDAGVEAGLTTMSKTTIQDGIYTKTTKRTVYPGGVGRETTVDNSLPEGQRITTKPVVMKGPQSWAYDKPKTNNRQ